MATIKALPGAPPLGEVSGAQVELLFGLWIKLVRAGVLYRGSVAVEVYMIVAPLDLALVDGKALLPGDERLLIRAVDLAGAAEPRAGDYVTENGNGLRRDVVAVEVDPARQLWTLYVRKALV
jgi:hypothetical protein